MERRRKWVERQARERETCTSTREAQWVAREGRIFGFPSPRRQCRESPRHSPESLPSFPQTRESRKATKSCPTAEAVRELRETTRKHGRSVASPFLGARLEHGKEVEVPTVPAAQSAKRSLMRRRSREERSWAPTKIAPAQAGWLGVDGAASRRVIARGLAAHRRWARPRYGFAWLRRGSVRGRGCQCLRRRWQLPAVLPRNHARHHGGLDALEGAPTARAPHTARARQPGCARAPKTGTAGRAPQRQPRSFSATSAARPHALCPSQTSRQSGLPPPRERGNHRCASKHAEASSRGRTAALTAKMAKPHDFLTKLCHFGTKASF